MSDGASDVRQARTPQCPRIRLLNYWSKICPSRLWSLARPMPRQFGSKNPILVDRENVVRAGHGRLEAAKLCGMTTVPVIRFEHMSPSDFRA